jgi:hypothetical protein
MARYQFSQFAMSSLIVAWERLPTMGTPPPLRPPPGGDSLTTTSDSDWTAIMQVRRRGNVFTESLLRNGRLFHYSSSQPSCHNIFAFMNATTTMSKRPLWRENDCLFSRILMSVNCKLKDKLSLCLIKHYAMKAYRGVEVQLHELLMFALHECELLTSRSSRFTQRAATPCAYCIGAWVYPTEVWTLRPCWEPNPNLSVCWLLA